ncbi:Fe(3+) dicitrate transport protein [Chitinophaga niastensis]|uniref:Fe(3+) dicitrate transport protein n=1 Tax=Chitinophaga niastensis TaxID=536980 RepID=A0A2P8HHM8_CHINA|nr:TonB-dependent receptor [Chitinophaga niastensis]PSL45707.1 Fe(3+) dicitrate transport protein [Chitinophaga niastensis]
MYKLLFGLPFVLLPFVASAQRPADSIRIHYLKDVRINAIRTVRGTGHLPEEKDGIIYSGKKNEVIIVDSLDANKAINNTRQILGRIPGLNIAETESGGFTANGIATRGLNPTQSIEMNTRQNGYNIASDIYGYNEAYYLPPMEAVSRIEMVRGASSLQFGPQFGGLVNYVLNEPPKNKPFEFYTSETAGSFGMFNTFNSFAGTIKKWSYYGFLQYRTLQGYRPNSQQWQVSGFGRIQYDASEKLKVGVEYSLLRNRIKMPGGLNDSMFNADPKSSFRARNWLKSPWNVVTGYLNYAISPATALNIKTTYLFSSRALVWRNENGGPEALDTIDPATGQYVPREVQNEAMHNSTTEIRLLHNYKMGSTNNTLAGGLRYSYAWFKRQGGGEGTTAADFDLSVKGEYEYNLDFTTTNIAPFIENIFRINKAFSITPGFRFEYLRSTAKGYITDSAKVFTDNSRSRSIPLFGIGAEYKTSPSANLYANISQAYRPIDYAQITPIGITSKIDPNLKDAAGFNADLGYRGTVNNYLNFDIGLFYLAYNRRIGTVLLTDAKGQPYTYRTNVANSVHKGLESYVEFNILKYLHPESAKGISIFDSFGYTDAKYTSGEFKNNRVEAAVKYINRVGVIYNNTHFSATFQMNNVGDAYGDATNAKFSTDPVAGYIPAYTVYDVSATYKFGRYACKAGINNLSNKAYFTRRTDEYPGPGIIPSDGRSFYVGISGRF